MRGGIFVGVLSLAAVATFATSQADGAPSADRTVCDGTPCGVPYCWDPELRTRPGIELPFRIVCFDATHGELKTPPAHSRISNLSFDWDGFRFDVLAEEDAPRHDQAVFELTGLNGTVVEQTVDIEVVPTSENSPPRCWGSRVSQRSDGTGPVEVDIGQGCWDPDGDQVVIEGGPPGTHLDSPRVAPPGPSMDGNWVYRTATSSGTETTTMWATDVLGARSNVAEIEVTVGPGVDRPAECRPPSSSWRDPDPIYTRPGATRRFAIYCEDEDGDHFTPVVTDPPVGGALAVVPGPLAGGWWGVQSWNEATYVPIDSSLDPDPFAVTPVGLGGTGPAGRMAMVPRPPSENGGGGCNDGYGHITAGVPGLLYSQCDDEEGDALSAEVVEEPLHGSAGPPLLTPAPFGATDLTIPYEPDPGFEGYDCVKVEVTDGHGLTMRFKMDIWVDPAPEIPPLPPEIPPVELPDPPIDPGVSTREAAQRALGTDAVKRMRGVEGAEVWARNELARGDLARYHRAAGMVVVCERSCHVRSTSRLAGSKASPPPRRNRSVLAGTPGQVHVLSLSVGRNEARALRRADRPRGRFQVSIRPAGEQPQLVKRSIPISR